MKFFPLNRQGGSPELPKGAASHPTISQGYTTLFCSFAPTPSQQGFGWSLFLPGWPYTSFYCIFSDVYIKRTSPQCSSTGCLPKGSDINCFTETCYAMVIMKSFKIKHYWFLSFGLEEKAFNRGHLAGEGGVGPYNTIKLAESQALIADGAYFGLTEVLKHSGLQNNLSLLPRNSLLKASTGTRTLSLWLLQWKSLAPQASRAG